MKSLAIAFLALTASVAAAQLPIPAKSSISISESKSTVAAVKMGPKCRLGYKLITYVPTVKLGADLPAGSDVRWMFYSIFKTTDGIGVQKAYSRKLEPATPAKLRPLIATEEVWACSCCRDLNKKNPDVIGWYSEILCDGAVVCKAQYPASGLISKAVDSMTPLSLRQQLSIGPKAVDISGGSSTTIKTHDALLITTPTGARVSILVASCDGPSMNYKWKYQAGPHAPVEAGEGEVRESSTNGTKDAAHNTKIEAGELTLNWSRGGPDKSYIYCNPQKASCEILPAERFADPPYPTPTSAGTQNK